MGSVASFEHICRLCGLESNDLINLFQNAFGERNLTTVIKKYIRVNVNPRDALPHQVCGPCVAKLDEVVEFMDISQATQNKLKNQLKECSLESNHRIPEDRLYELIQDVKVELEETDAHFIDNISDEDFDARTRRGRRSRAKHVRGHLAATKGPCGTQLSKSKTTLLLHEQDITEVKKDNGGDSTNDLSLKHKEIQDENKAVWTEEEPGEKDNVLLAREMQGNAVKSGVRCCICKATFSHFEQLASHSLDVHQLPEPRCMCPQCPRTFPKISSMNNHQRRKHQNSLQGCPKCKKLYPAHYLWTRHMLVHTNTRPFSCDECDKKFKSKAELFIHKKTHRPSEERYTHCCEICGKRFTQKANLESHLRLHTGNRPFSCEFCGKCFSQRGNMEEHRRIHTGEKPFACDVCGVSYSRQGQLAMHRRKHSGEKPHKCQYCNKEFLRREVLRKHEHMHTDTRPYKCSYCEKSFRDQGKKKVHERLHTGERPFECQLCGRGFCESGNLRKHLRVHQRRPGAVVSAVSSVRERDPLGIGSTVVSSGQNYNVAVISHSTFPTPEIPTCHSVDGNSESSLMAIVEVPLPATISSRQASHSLPFSAPTLSEQISDSSGTSNHASLTLQPHESPSLPQEEREKEDFRVSSAPFHSVSWALYPN